MVFSADADRERECRNSAEAFLARAEERQIGFARFRDGFLPFVGAEVKDRFESLKAEISPDIVFTHYRDDRHQDHRLLSDLTWNTFRDHTILEYEIPKYDGDFGRPTVFVPLTTEHCRRKIEHLVTHYETQRSKPWFSEELFRSVMRIRGMECAAKSGFAEAFYARKIVVRAGGGA
jgi:LmbE family N-acetylglucosaminyl deacetylase